MKCINCSNKKPLKGQKRIVQYTECGLDDVILDGITVYTCPECGEEYFDYGNIIQLHSLIQDAIMKKAGLLTGPQIRFLRKVHGFSKEFFAGMVGVEERTVYRWESGKNITTQVDKTVRIAFAYADSDRYYDYHDYLLKGKKGVEYKSLRIKPNKSGFSLRYA